jgi:HK97 family phage major capsid protein
MATATRDDELTAEKLAGMNLGQLRAEAKIRYERAAAIEKKYPDGPITNTDDEAEVKDLLRGIDRIEDRLSPLEEHDERKSRIFSNVQRYNERAGRVNHATASRDGGRGDYRSPGEQFLEHPSYKALRDSGVFNSNATNYQMDVVLENFSSKTLLYAGSGGTGGPFVTPDYQPGLRVPILTRELTILDLIPRSGTTSDSISYVAETTFTNSAAPVPQATATTGTSGTKPESTLIYTTQLAPVRTIAHWLPVTNRMLQDAPALRGIIDSRLLLGLNLTLESQIISGDGTGENLLGLLNAAGINIQPRGTDNQQDAIFKGMTQVRVTGLSIPTAIALNPLDYQTIRLARENAATATAGAGSYIMGPPSQPGPATLWGLPLAQSLGLPQGTSLTGAFDMDCMLFDREEGNIRVGYIDQQFVRNMQSILAELRAAFVTWRGAAFSKITGL